jgi:hypothetical protein
MAPSSGVVCNFEFYRMTLKLQALKENRSFMIDMLIDCWCLTPISAIFQLCHGNQFYWLKKPEYPERTTDHGQATGKLYHLRLSYFKLRFHNIPWKVRNKFLRIVPHITM